MVLDQRVLSLFDILGPIMVGPSSNHVAGAVRIGNMARMIFGEEPSEVKLFFYGPLAETYKGQKTDLAILAGLLEMDIDDEKIMESLEIAHQKNIKFSVHTQTYPKIKKDPNTMGMVLKSINQSMEIEGISPGGGEVIINKIGEFCLDLRGNKDTILIITKDKENEFVRKKIENLFGENLTNNETFFVNQKALLLFNLNNPIKERDFNKLDNIKHIKLKRMLNCLYSYKLKDNFPLFMTVKEMLKLIKKQKITLPDIIIQYELKRSGLNEREIRSMFKKIWMVMKESTNKGLQGVKRPPDSIVGNDSNKIYKAHMEGKTITGDLIPLVIARAMACREVATAMGKVVASPTSGSCGVIPSVIITMSEKLKSTEKEIIDALLVAAMIGVLIANHASLSGSAGGCQSEVGVSSGMAAGAVAQLAGGTPLQVVNASAIALKNMFGLTCDTIANAIEVPCIKKNVVGAVNAIATSEMALTGIESVIPLDEVILALKNIQGLMPFELRNTQLGGLGITETAKRLKKEWMKKIK